MPETVMKEQQLNNTFHALADPSRRKIVNLLRESGELKIGDIAKAFEMSLNGVSKHLKVLERAELIHRRIEGREHFISVHWAALQAPYEWLHFFQNYWNDRLDKLVDYVKTKRRKK